MVSLNNYNACLKPLNKRTRTFSLAYSYLSHVIPLVAAMKFAFNNVTNILIHIQAVTAIKETLLFEINNRFESSDPYVTATFHDPIYNSKFLKLIQSYDQCDK